MIAKLPIKNLKGFDIIAILSVVGVVGWIITDFFGGMILFLIAYGLIIIPFLILYLISFIDTIISLIRIGKKTSSIKLISHGIIVITVLIFNLYHSEAFKSEKMMSAILKDDLYQYRLMFRENGNVENQANGIFCFSKTFHGKYFINDDLIVFEKVPYDNDFIPDTLLIDLNQKALFMEKDSVGNFRTEKEWLNHFEIE